MNALADELARTRARESELLADLRHDLRTPLTVIAGYAAALADGTATGPSAQRAAAAIAEEAGRLERLVGELGAIDRLRAGSDALHLEPIDADAIISRRPSSASRRRLGPRASRSTAGPPVGRAAGDGRRGRRRLRRSPPIASPSTGSWATSSTTRWRWSRRADRSASRRGRRRRRRHRRSGRRVLGPRRRSRVRARRHRPARSSGSTAAIRRAPARAAGSACRSSASWPGPTAGAAIAENLSPHGARVSVDPAGPAADHRRPARTPDGSGGITQRPRPSAAQTIISTRRGRGAPPSARSGCR